MQRKRFSRIIKKAAVVCMATAVIIVTALQITIHRRSRTKNKEWIDKCISEPNVV